MDRTEVLDLRSSVFDPFVNALRRHVAPDFGIDFVGEAIRENQGLVFMHRSSPEAEVYFVSNLQDRVVDSRVAFRVSGRRPEEWNPYTGETRPLLEYDDAGTSVVVPVRLAPYASTIYVFAAGGPQSHVVASDFSRVLRFDEKGMEALASRNGVYQVVVSGPAERSVTVGGIPAVYEVEGEWELRLEGKGFARTERKLGRLRSWTEDAATRHFSGTGSYTVEFGLPAAYISDELVLQLELGAVGNVAEVELNGHRLGVIWMRGQRLEATHAAKAGRNVLKVEVTNTLINRVSGWQSVPELPEKLKAVYGRGLADGSPGARGLFGFEPLPRSGLLGPVTIVPLKKVRLSWGSH
jgi:hypothetical protein